MKRKLLREMVKVRGEGGRAAGWESALSRLGPERRRKLVEMVREELVHAVSAYVGKDEALFGAVWSVTQKAFVFLALINFHFLVRCSVPRRQYKHLDLFWHGAVLTRSRLQSSSSCDLNFESMKRSTMQRFQMQGVPFMRCRHRSFQTRLPSHLELLLSRLAPCSQPRP